MREFVFLDGETDKDCFSQVPMARASILWLIAEYAEPKIAPDVLRKIAKTFCQEEDIVKLQALNLASRLSLTNSQPQTKLIVQYIFNLAKYDQNYDIRDRVRFLRHLCAGAEAGTGLGRFSKKFLLASKPAPKLQSPFGGREQYQMGSLSHLINQPAAGYQELPDFPDEAPDPTVRDVTPPPTPVLTRHEGRKSSRFYEDSDEDAREFSGSESSESSSSDSESDSDSESGSEESQSDDKASNDESDEHDAKPKQKRHSDESESLSESTDDSDILRKARNLNSAKNNNNFLGAGDVARNGSNNEKNLRNSNNNHFSKKSSSKKIIPSDDDSSSPSDDDDEDEQTSSSEDEKVAARKQPKKSAKKSSSTRTEPKPKPQSVDLLLDLDDLEENIPAPTLPLPMMQQGISSLVPSVKEPSRIVTPVTNAVVPVLERQVLVSVQDWIGLEVLFRYTRCENIYSPKMTSLEFTFENKTDRVFEKISVRPAEGIAIEVKAAESQVALNPGMPLVTTVGVDFKDSAQEVRLVLNADGTSHEVRITPPVGEIIRPVIVSLTDFEHFKKTLGGMCESSAEVSCALGSEQLRDAVQKKLNVIVVEGDDSGVGSDSAGKVRFAAQTMSSQCLVLIATEPTHAGNLRVVVNCERMVVGKMLLTQIKKVLQEAG